jgi:hypothetical protein
MYEYSSGHRLSVVVRPLPPKLPCRDLKWPGTTNGCDWIERGLSYAVVAALPDNELDRIAEQITAKAARPTG